MTCLGVEPGPDGSQVKRYRMRIGSRRGNATDVVNPARAEADDRAECRCRVQGWTAGVAEVAAEFGKGQHDHDDQ